MSSSVTDRIAEALARADYECNEWSGCNGSRWDALPEPARQAAFNRFRPVAERVEAELQLTEEWTDDIAGPEWARYMRWVTPVTVRHGPRYLRSPVPEEQP